MIFELEPDAWEREARIVDALADVADDGVRAAMAAAFVRSSQYEWMFWDAAWRLETWPVAPA